MGGKTPDLLCNRPKPRPAELPGNRFCPPAGKKTASRQSIFSSAPAKDTLPGDMA